MKSEYIKINDILTHVITWGKSLDDKFSNNENELIILLPGNPGILSYYTSFCSQLRDTIGYNIPIWSIGHAGHDFPLNSINELPNLNSNHAKYNLNGQIQQKVEFIKKFVPDHVKIILIGHSIGSWMALELLKNSEIKSKISKAYLLFPAIEKMIDTPNGKKLHESLKSLFVLKLFLTFLLMLPKFFQILFQFCYMYFNGYPLELIEPGLIFSHPKLREIILFQAKDQLHEVNELDVNFINENKSKIKFFYGAKDGWTPRKFYSDLCSKIPNVDAVVDDSNLKHNFMTTHDGSYRLAEIVSGWIDIQRNKN